MLHSVYRAKDSELQGLLSKIYKQEFKKKKKNLILTEKNFQR